MSKKWLSCFVFLLCVLLCGCGKQSGENGASVTPSPTSSVSDITPAADDENGKGKDSDNKENNGSQNDDNNGNQNDDNNGNQNDDNNETRDDNRLKKVTYKIDYHKLSPFYTEYYSAESIEMANLVIDAFLAGKTEVSVPETDRQGIEKVHALVRVMCPPFIAFADVLYNPDYTQIETKIEWKINRDWEEIRTEIAEFEQTAYGYLDDIYENDTEAMKALTIYYDYAKDLNYDYDLTGDDFGGLPDDEVLYRTSSFCAIKNHTGMCFNIAEGLAFLFNVADITAGTVGSYEGMGAHDWTIASVDGKYYYFDATWDSDSSDLGSLSYFGITEEERAEWAGEYPVDSVYYACTEPIHGRYNLSDQRFLGIHGFQTAYVREIRFDHENQSVYIDSDSSYDGIITLDLGVKGL